MRLLYTTRGRSGWPPRHFALASREIYSKGQPFPLCWGLHIPPTFMFGISTWRLVLHQQPVAFPPPTFLASDQFAELKASTACHWNGASLAAGCFEPVLPELRSPLWKLNLMPPLQAKLTDWVCFHCFTFLASLPCSPLFWVLMRWFSFTALSHSVFSILLIGGNEPSSGRNSPLPYRPDSRPLTPTYAQAPKHFHVPGRSWHSVSCCPVAV